VWLQKLLLLLFIYCPSKKGTKGTVDGVITKENKKEKKRRKRRTQTHIENSNT